MATSTWSDILQPVLRAVRRPDIRVQIDSSNYHQTATLPCDPCDSYPVQIAGFPVDVADLSTSDSLPAPFSLHNLQDELQFCADRLVELARRASESRVFVSPFANEARRYGLNIVGTSESDSLHVYGNTFRKKRLVSARAKTSREFP
ncbi:unnamed protein product [Protopolystoma xenopodis]|uniref:Uncharacterized protein n=1 Tax=Protopolystoma xenopodis TaxID=117903 RepID=A0A448X4J2_9PLAT|nr:unnamed protein product [Protopolystoma xenopodis]